MCTPVATRKPVFEFSNGLPSISISRTPDPCPGRFEVAATWVIPVCTNEFGLQVIRRSQGKQHLAPEEERAFNSSGVTRVRGLLVDGSFWYPRFPRVHRLVPHQVVLAWPEFHLEGPPQHGRPTAPWLTVSELFGDLDELNASSGGGFTNTGPETLFDALSRTAIDWDGTPSYLITLRDVTEQRRQQAEYEDALERERQWRHAAELAERRAAFLADASTLLAGSLECESALAVETHRVTRMAAQAARRAALTRGEYSLWLLLPPSSGMVRASCPCPHDSPIDARHCHRRVRPSGRRAAERTACSGPRDAWHLRASSRARTRPSRSH